MKIKEYIKDVLKLILIDNENGLQLELCNYGASIHDLKVIDNKNNLESIVLTPSNTSDFLNVDYYGKTIGRFSGRIDKGICRINGIEYKLDINWNGVSSLHGGYSGISQARFDYYLDEKEEYLDVVFTFLEKENKLPGDVDYKITYRIFKNDNKFTILFNAITNKDTLVNLTNHAFFNLSGNGKKNVLNQQLKLYCDKYTNLNNELITVSVDNVDKVFDFRESHEIGKYIYDESLQNHKALGYDHCWIKENKEKELVAEMIDLDSGRMLEVSTSYPAIVCYAGCYPNDVEFNEEKFKIGQYHSLCLECQYIPNGINMDNVDKAILRKNEEYSHFINYKFNILKER